MMAAPPHHDGLLLRARYTPMRDVIRLRLTGRLNIRGQVHAANLPQPLSELVLEVVRRTRLSRLEKSDVTRELIAHFADGLESGATVEQLRKDFGDAHQAAKLIRRAKRRNHNALQRVPRYSIYTLCALAAVYLIVAVRFFTGAPNIAHDYLIDLNAAAAAVPPEQAAWPRYRSALVEMGSMPAWPKGHTPQPGEGEWGEAERYVREHAQSIATVRQAAMLPHLGYTAAFEFHEDDRALWPWQDEDVETHPHDRLLIGVLLPHLSELRKLALLLRYEASIAAVNNDGERIVSNVAAILGIAHHSREIPTLINQLVAFAIMDLALNVVGDSLESHPHVFTDEMLTELAHMLAAALDPGPLQLDISTERLWFADLLQHMYTDNGRGNGRLTSSGLEAFALVATMNEGPFGFEVPPMLQKLASPAAGLILANRRDMQSRFEQLLTRAEAESRKPLWQHVDTVGPELAAMVEDPVQAMRYAPIAIMMPSLTRVAIQAELLTMRRDGVLAVIAMHVHHRRTGQWPQSLGELVPHLLPSVPVDRYDGRPLRYEIRDGSPVLYSIGANRHDDGGIAQQKFATKQMEGDLILWPPQRDPPVY